MPIVQIILMVLMLNGRVSASRTVSMWMVIMNAMFVHNRSFPVRLVRRVPYCSKKFVQECPTFDCECRYSSQRALMVSN